MEFVHASALWVNGEYFIKIVRNEVDLTRDYYIQELFE